MQTKVKYFVLALIILVADQVSKVWATHNVSPVDTIEIIPNFFRFTYARNRGVAFSLFADSKFDIKWVLAAISFFAAIGVVYYLIRLASNKFQLNLSLSLLLAGIVGNLIDRVRLGEVVDFIDFHWYEKYTFPTFNIADSAICIGAALLALEMLMEEKSSSHNSTLTD